MPRRKRAATGGVVFHVLNRGNGRARIFHKDADYEAFERVLGEAKAGRGKRVRNRFLPADPAIRSHRPPLHPGQPLEHG